MTFDGPINSTYGEAVAQIRDKISSMANWSVADEQYANDSTSLSHGDYVVFTTPEGSDVRLEITNSGEIRLEHGPSWDSGAGSWSDKYSNEWRAFPHQESDYSPSMAMSDEVRWWVEYVDAKGWAFAITREMGDNDDKAMAMGFSELTRLWDYTTAQVRESKYTALVVGPMSDDYSGTNSIVNGTFEGGVSGSTYDGKGQVNADGNNDNFPMVETSLQASDKYEGALIGEHDLWIRDNSGSRSAHLDTVTDGGGDLYTLFTENMVEPVGIRME